MATIDLHAFLPADNDLEWLTLVIQEFTIIIPREVLSHCSDYFRAMFGNFREASETNIEIDVNYSLEKKHLETFFKKMIDVYNKKEKSMKLYNDMKGYKIELMSSCEETKHQYEYQSVFDENSYENKVPLQKFYVLSGLANYFHWNYYLDELTEYVLCYFNYLEERLDSSLKTYKMKCFVPTQIVLVQIGNYLTDGITRDFDEQIRSELKQRLVGDFLNNFENLYLLCRDLKLTNELLNLFLKIELGDKIPKKIEPGQIDFPRKEMSETLITYRSLADIFEKMKVILKDLEEINDFYKVYSKKAKITNNTCNVFDFYNDLKYKKPESVYKLCFDAETLPVHEEEALESTEPIEEDISEPVRKYSTKLPVKKIQMKAKKEDDEEDDSFDKHKQIDIEEVIAIEPEDEEIAIESDEEEKPKRKPKQKPVSKRKTTKAIDSDDEDIPPKLTDGEIMELANDFIKKAKEEKKELEVKQKPVPKQTPKPKPIPFISKSIITAIPEPDIIPEGERITYTEEEFVQRFHQFSDNIFNEIKWNNFVVAGGYLFSCLNKTKHQFLPSTDIDIFIYGSTKEDRINAVEYLTNYFEKFNVYFTVNKSIINIIRPNARNIQIICTGATSPNEVINQFDTSYVKLYYDGKKLQATYDMLLSIKTQSTTFVNDAVHAHRLYKALRKGLQLKFSVDKSYTCRDIICHNNILVEKFGNHPALYKLLINNYNPIGEEKDIVHNLMINYKTMNVSKLAIEILPHIKYDAKFTNYGGTANSIEQFKNMPLKYRTGRKSSGLVCFSLPYEYTIKMPYVVLKAIWKPNAMYNTTDYGFIIDIKEYPQLAEKINYLNELINEKLRDTLQYPEVKKVIKIKKLENYSNPIRKINGSEEDEKKGDIVLHIIVPAKVPINDKMKIEDIKPGYLVKCDMQFTKIHIRDRHDNCGSYKLIATNVYVKKNTIIV